MIYCCIIVILWNCELKHISCASLTKLWRQYHSAPGKVSITCPTPQPAIWHGYSKHCIYAAGKIWTRTSLKEGHPNFRGCILYYIMYVVVGCFSNPYSTTRATNATILTRSTSSVIWGCIGRYKQVIWCGEITRLPHSLPPYSLHTPLKSEGGCSDIDKRSSFQLFNPFKSNHGYSSVHSLGHHRPPKPPSNINSFFIKQPEC